MAVAKTISVQNDFSVGELDPSAKRGDSDKALRAGLRQLSNFRILNSKKVNNRLGRSAKFISNPGARIEEVLMSPGNVFLLDFRAGQIVVRTLAGAVVFTSTLLGDGITAIPWTSNTVNQIVWDSYQLQVFICYPGIPPQILAWDGVSTWTLATFAELTVGGHKHTPFYRISSHSITMQPSGVTGSITLVAGSPYFVGGMAGTRILFVGRQILINSVTDSTHASATVEEPLPSGMTLGFTSDPAGFFSIGDEIIGSVTGSKGIITNIASGPMQITVQLLQVPIVNADGSTASSFTTSDFAVGPAGSLQISAIVAVIAPQPITAWDEEVMNSFRGWPSSVFVDQNRLGFCNFPSVPNGIAWSALGSPTDLDVNAVASSPDNSIFEIAPGKGVVRYVVPGAESSEFVFMDNAIHYIPITPTNPLQPGSVGFNLLSSEGCAAVQPRRVQESIAYVPAGGNSMRAIVTTGAYYRPHEVRRVSMDHDHLFNTPIAIAAPGATDPNFPEIYVYVANSDGSLAVAKMLIENGQLTQDPGWMKFTGVGSVNWVSARSGSGDVWFSTTYPQGPVTIAELNDATQYLDAAIFVNNVPSGLPIPGGKGPLWWYANGSVFLIDQGTRFMGVYQIDANGNIIPQNIDGENLLSAQLVAGQQWTATAERFVPGVNEGPEGQGGPQRMRKRRVARDVVYVQNSSGFVIQSLRGGNPQAQRRIETWNQGEDPTQPPKLRELAYEFRFKGRDHDPRHVIIKDTPGPLTILEWTSEVTW